MGREALGPTDRQRNKQTHIARHQKKVQQIEKVTKQTDRWMDKPRNIQTVVWTDSVTEKWRDGTWREIEKQKIRKTVEKTDNQTETYGWTD